jgi:hypothetical protein
MFVFYLFLLLALAIIAPQGWDSQNGAMTLNLMTSDITTLRNFG